MTPWTRPRARFTAAAHAAGAFSRRDPTLFLAVFAAWMLLNAVSLLLPGQAFAASPLYALARDLGLPETLTGLLMLLNAMALLWCLGEPRPRVQAWVGLVTGGLWCFWALLMFLSGLRVHLFSATASWNVVAAFCLMQTTRHPVASPQPSGAGRDGAGRPDDWQLAAGED